MHRRYEATNIPIEILRSLVTICDEKSVTRAAQKLNLTQPAVSGHIKRLQQILGGDVFHRASPGVELTEKGMLVERYARQLLAINDQIMGIMGPAPSTRIARIGVPSVFAQLLLPPLFARTRERGLQDCVQFCCEPSADLLRRVQSGYLDLVFACATEVPPMHALASWREPLAWACAPTLLVSPGAPIPLQSWPEAVSDCVALESMAARRLSYRITFIASDLASHLAALRSGTGFFILPERAVPNDLKRAHEHYLPPLPDNHAGIYAREGFDFAKFDPVVEVLKAVVRPAAANAAERTQRSAVERSRSKVG